MDDENEEPPRPELFMLEANFGTAAAAFVLLLFEGGPPTVDVVLVFAVCCSLFSPLFVGFTFSLLLLLVVVSVFFFKLDFVFLVTHQIFISFVHLLLIIKFN